MLAQFYDWFFDVYFIDLEAEDDMMDLKDADSDTASVVNRAFIKELDTMKQLTRLNLMEHSKQKNRAAVLAP